MLRSCLLFDAAENEQDKRDDREVGDDEHREQKLGEEQPNDCRPPAGEQDEGSSCYSCPQEDGIFLR